MKLWNGVKGSGMTLPRLIIVKYICPKCDCTVNELEINKSCELKKIICPLCGAECIKEW